jgi:hypothetical protein
MLTYARGLCNSGNDLMSKLPLRRFVGVLFFPAGQDGTHEIRAPFYGPGKMGAELSRASPTARHLRRGAGWRVGGHGQACVPCLHRQVMRRMSRKPILSKFCAEIRLSLVQKCQHFAQCVYPKRKEDDFAAEPVAPQQSKLVVEFVRAAEPTGDTPVTNRSVPG